MQCFVSANHVTYRVGPVINKPNSVLFLFGLCLIGTALFWMLSKMGFMGWNPFRFVTSRSTISFTIRYTCDCSLLVPTVIFRIFLNVRISTAIPGTFVQLSRWYVAGWGLRFQKYFSSKIFALWIRHAAALVCFTVGVWCFLITRRLYEIPIASCVRYLLVLFNKLR